MAGKKKTAPVIDNRFMLITDDEPTVAFKLSIQGEIHEVEDTVATMHRLVLQAQAEKEQNNPEAVDYLGNFVDLFEKRYKVRITEDMAYRLITQVVTLFLTEKKSTNG